MAGPRIRITVIRPRGAEFNGAALRRGATRVVTDVTFDGVRFVARYPPQSLVESGYVRTGTLARSWSARVQSGARKIEGTVGSNSNIAPYNEIVQGEDPVAMFPQAGWRGVDDLDDFLQTRVERGMDALLARLTR